MARVPLSKFSRQVLSASCPEQVSSKFSAQVALSKLLAQVPLSKRKFSAQVALSKMLARVPLSKFSKQVTVAWTGEKGQLQDTLGNLNPTRRSVERVGAARTARVGKKAGRPFRPRSRRRSSATP